MLTDTRSRFAAVRWPACLALLLLQAAPPAQPYAVGHQGASWIDGARGNRAVPVEIYYPGTSAGTGVPVAGAPGETYPVIAFGHGFTMVVDRYAWIWQALVPAGVMVVLPTTEGSLTPDHQAFGLDLAFVVERLQLEGSSAGSMFFGRVGPDAAVMGHSMGGGASLLAAAASPAITAVAAFAPAETNPSATTAAATISVPVLLFGGSSDCVAPPAQHVIPMYSAFASSCKAYVEITDGMHCRFASTDFACEFGEGLAGCPVGLARGTQQQITLQLLENWLDAVLRQDFSAWVAYRADLTSIPGVVVQEACATSPLGVCGDCDCNGTIDILDALTASQHSVGTVALTGAAFARCDVNGSQSVQITDALAIAQQVVGLPTVLSCF